MTLIYINSITFLKKPIALTICEVNSFVQNEKQYIINILKQKFKLKTNFTSVTKENKLFQYT